MSSEALVPLWLQDQVMLLERQPSPQIHFLHLLVLVQRQQRHQSPQLVSIDSGELHDHGDSFQAYIRL